MSTIATRTGNDLIYEVNGNAADYGWGLTEDGQGIVIWDETGFQILPASVQLKFSDKTVDSSGLFEEPSDEPPVHKLSGSSADWGWGLTDDGKGIVVWSDSGFEILPANVQLEFSDKTVDTSVLFGDPGDGGPVHTLQGSSSDWGWGLTEDRKGIVVWNDNGFEILPARVQLKFSDQTVDTSHLFDELGSVAGTVWFDEGQNGLRDGGEAGLSGVTVRLNQRQPDGSTTLVAETTTGADGTYKFEDLADGDYFIFVELPGVDGGFYHYTEQVTSEAADSLNSDVRVARGDTEVFTLGPETKTATLDAGFVFVEHHTPDPNAELGSIGGTVWLDANQNGLMDAGEGHLSNVRIQLRDADGKLLHETISDPDGKFVFEDREAGDYSVYFADIGSFTFTEKDVAGNANDGLDSDVNAATALTDVFTLGAGESIETLGAGLVQDTGLPEDFIA